jgi:hypothetical protein
MRASRDRVGVEPWDTEWAGQKAAMHGDRDAYLEALRIRRGAA